MSQGKITDKQREILEYIKEMILKKGYPPAVREICEAVHLKSTSSVHSHLESLEKNGYIRRDPTKPRTIEILDDDFALTRRELVNVPVIGTVAAGVPILAEQNIEDYLPIPAEILPNKEVFMLKVKGNSMIEAGIYNGDKVIVAKQPNAENGDKVVALVDDSATVKTFYKENGHFRLQPENSSMDPIILDQVEILGKVIGLFHRDELAMTCRSKKADILYGSEKKPHWISMTIRHHSRSGGASCFIVFQILPVPNILFRLANRSLLSFYICLSGVLRITMQNLYP